MKYVSTILFVFLISFNSVCQITVEAQVVNSTTGKDIPYAHVWFQNTTYGTYANSKGIFKIEAHFEQSDSLMISCVGYETLSIHIDDIRKNGTVRLEDYPITLFTVEKVAAKLDKEFNVGYSRKSPIPYSWYTTVISKNSQHHFRVLLPPKSVKNFNQGFLCELNIGIRELRLPKNSEAVLEVNLAVNVDFKEQFLNTQPIYAKFDPEDLPLSIDLSNLSISNPGSEIILYLTFLGAENLQGNIQEAIVSMYESAKETKAQKIFMRRGEEEIWKGVEFFRKNEKKYHNIQTWITICHEKRTQ